MADVTVDKIQEMLKTGEFITPDSTEDSSESGPNLLADKPEPVDSVLGKLEIEKPFQSVYKAFHKPFDRENPEEWASKIGAEELEAWTKQEPKSIDYSNVMNAAVEAGKQLNKGNARWFVAQVKDPETGKIIRRDMAIPVNEKLIYAKDIMKAIDDTGRTTEILSGKGAAVALTELLSDMVAPRDTILNKKKDVMDAVYKAGLESKILSREDLDAINDPESIDVGIPVDFQKKFSKVIKAGVDMVAKGGQSEEVLKAAMVQFADSDEFRQMKPKEKANALSLGFDAMRAGIMAKKNELVVKATIDKQQMKQTIGKKVAEGSNDTISVPVSQEKRVELQAKATTASKRLADIEVKISSETAKADEYGIQLADTIDQAGGNSKALREEIRTGKDMSKIQREMISKLPNSGALLAAFDSYKAGKMGIASFGNYREEAKAQIDELTELLTTGYPVSKTKLDTLRKNIGDEGWAALMGNSAALDNALKMLTVSDNPEQDAQMLIVNAEFKSLRKDKALTTLWDTEQQTYYDAIAAGNDALKDVPGGLGIIERAKQLIIQSATKDQAVKSAFVAKENASFQLLAKNNLFSFENQWGVKTMMSPEKMSAVDVDYVQLDIIERFKADPETMEMNLNIFKEAIKATENKRKIQKLLTATTANTKPASQNEEKKRVSELKDKTTGKVVGYRLSDGSIERIQ